MYTQVAFAEFFDSVIGQTGIEFKEYPNVAIRWNHGDWGYEILNNMSVRIFRYAVPDRQITIDGPQWHDARETRESFQPRFQTAFSAAIAALQ